MSTLDIVLLVAALLATLYEVMQISGVSALLSRYGRVHITPGFYLGMLFAVAVQVAFIVSITR